EIIYRMAAGELPESNDFFVPSDMGALSLDGVKLKLSRESLEWSLARFRKNPSALDYVSLAVPRGVLRPGAGPAGAAAEVIAGGAGGGGGGVIAGEAVAGGGNGDRAGALAHLIADATGGFDRALEASPALEAALAGDAPLVLVAADGDGEATRVELIARGHGA